MELADDAKPKGEDGRGKMEDGGEAPTKAAIRHPPSSSFDPQSYVPRTLDHDLKTRRRLPYADCLKISLALADAVKHLHDNGLVHRDIKPGNIIFVHGMPKLADIGLVTDSDATLIYDSTRGFLAPEGAGRPQGDLYSLGKVMYEMWSGQDRMQSPEVPPGWAQWPDHKQINELRTISNRACEPDPAKRYATADELIQDLELLKAGGSVLRMQMLARGRRWALGALAVGGILGALAVAGVWFFGRVREQAREDEVLVRKAQMLRIGERQEGWSSNAFQLLSRAGRGHSERQVGWSRRALQLLPRAVPGQPDHDELREQAAASMEGLDAHVVKSFTRTPVKNLAFDSQGRYLLMDAGGHGHVQTWDSQSDRLASFNTTNTGPVWFASGGSPRQLTYAGQGVFVLLNPEDGKSLQEFRFPEAAAGEELTLQALTVSADASFCAAAVRRLTNRDESKIAGWETTTGKLVAQATEPCGTLAFSPDKSCLAVGDDEGRVSLRALPYLTNVVAAFHQDRASIHCIAFARDPSQAADGLAKYPWLLATGDAGGMIYIYQVALGRLKTICRGSQYDVYTVAFSPDGMTIASGGRQAIHYWDVATGHSLLNIVRGDEHHALGFSPDGRKLAFGVQVGDSEVIDLEPDRGVMALRGLSSQSANVEFSHDGQRLAALSHNWEVGVWDLASNRLEWILQAPKGLYADNAALAFSRDDSQLAFATLTDARLWDLKTAGLSKSWQLPRGLVQQLCFDTARRLLLFQYDNWDDPKRRMCTVRDLLKPDYTTPIAEFPEFKGRVFYAVLSQHGDLVAVIGERERGGPNIVRVFDPLNGRLIRALPDTGNQGNDWLVTDLQASRIGCWFARRNQMVFFDMPDGKLWRAFPDQANALSPNGRWLSKQAHAGRGVTVFSADNPTKQFTIGLDHGVGFWQHFSPNGRLLAFGTPEGTVLVCDMEETVRRLDQLGLGWR
jgi:WD40 repeat protein